MPVTTSDLLDKADVVAWRYRTYLFYSEKQALELEKLTEEFKKSTGKFKKSTEELEKSTEEFKESTGELEKLGEECQDLTGSTVLSDNSY